MSKLLSFIFAAWLALGVLGTIAQSAHADQLGDGLRALYDSLLDDDGHADERRVDDYEYTRRDSIFPEKRRPRDFNSGFPRHEYFDYDRADDATSQRTVKKRRPATKKRITKKATTKTRRVAQARTTSAARRAARKKAVARQARARTATAKRVRARSTTTRARPAPNRTSSSGRIFEGNERYCSQGALDCNGFKNER